MAKKRIGLIKIEHLKDRLPWTMGLAGVIRMLVWQTQTVLGISKSELLNRLVDDVYQLTKESNRNKDSIQRKINDDIQKEIAKADVDVIHARPKPNSLISPIEAQRRIRYFSEKVFEQGV